MRFTLGIHFINDVSPISPKFRDKKAEIPHLPIVNIYLAAYLQSRGEQQSRKNEQIEASGQLRPNWRMRVCIYVSRGWGISVENCKAAEVKSGDPKLCLETRRLRRGAKLKNLDELRFPSHRRASS